jgi:peptidoglycan/xylan/chitin deacetylase (PgdA/CDA1 family)
MRTWYGGARWLAMVPLLLAAAALPDTGVSIVVPIAPAGGLVAADAAGSAMNAGLEENGMDILYDNRPVATAKPKPTPSMAELLRAELNPSRAPVPSGPVTYVPILLYHYIRINPNPRDTVGFSLSTPPAMFRMQMQYLADHGFHVVSLHQAVAAIKSHGPLPSRPVVLTFDDGYADFFTAAVPIMASHGFTATDFVISGRMGQWSFMTPSQVVAADGMGFNIGAHTVDHVALAAQTPSRASWEIRTSKATLETLLGHKVLDFAYPYGSFNAYDEAQAQSAGFETAVSTLYGTIHTAGQLFYLSRMRLGGGLPLSYFARVVGGPPPTAAELVGAPTPTPSPSPKPTVAPTPVPSPSPAPSAAPSVTADLSRPPAIWL